VGEARLVVGTRSAVFFFFFAQGFDDLIALINRR